MLSGDLLLSRRNDFCNARTAVLATDAKPALAIQGCQQAVTDLRDDDHNLALLGNKGANLNVALHRV